MKCVQGHRSPVKIALDADFAPRAPGVLLRYFLCGSIMYRISKKHACDDIVFGASFLRVILARKLAVIMSEGVTTHLWSIQCNVQRCHDKARTETDESVTIILLLLWLLQGAARSLRALWSRSSTFSSSAPTWAVYNAESCSITQCHYTACSVKCLHFLLRILWIIIIIIVIDSKPRLSLDHRLIRRTVLAMIDPILMHV